MQILNAFSVNMLACDMPASVRFEEVSVDRAADIAQEAESAVGHADTAAVFSDVLGVDVPAQRATIALNKGDMALLGQYRGPRLPEGATELPEGAKIQWIFVTVD